MDLVQDQAAVLVVDFLSKQGNRMSQYRDDRKRFYRTIPDFWADLYGMEYSLYHALPVSQALVTDLHIASKRIHQIFTKTAKFIRHLPDSSLMQLGYPVSTLPFIRMKTMYPDLIIGRLDLVVTAEGIKLLEYNSDTPTFIKECYQVNGLVCDHFQMQSPNQHRDEQLRVVLRKAIDASYQYLGLTRSARLVFSAHDDHQEDWCTTKYLQETCAVESDLVPLDQLLITDDGLFTPDGVQIDILYRQTYPIEHLVKDIDEETGDNIGIELLALVEQRKLAIINPPSAFLLQTKALQAYIWEMYEVGHPYFSDEEREWIKAYFLPTYYNSDRFTGIAHYVKKPSFGREGDTVQIFSADHVEELSNEHRTYEHEVPIYQQYVELPTTTLETERGKETLSYIYGCFVLAGAPSAIGVRAGEKITGNESYFLPVGLEKKQEVNLHEL